MVPTKQRVLLVLLVVLALASLSGAMMAAPAAQDALTSQLQAQSDGKVVVHRDDVTGVAFFVEAGDAALTREFAAQKMDAEGTARAFLTTYGGLFGLTDPSAQLKVTRTYTDQLGMTHVRFAQQQGGLPVFGGDLIVHLGADGAIQSASGRVAPDAAAVNLSASVSGPDAINLAKAQLGGVRAAVTAQELVVLQPGLFTDQPSGTFLTYRMRVEVAGRPELAQWVFVDAQSRDVRFSIPAVYEGRNRSTYNMKHGTNYGSATLARTEGQGPVTTAPNCTPTDVNNAHDYAGNTYDFFYSRFGRDSYNNAGGALLSYVCYSSNYQNAFWDGSRMTYGDGFAAADDVVGHELSHGVTEYASGLIYSYQSGALNESYSDIFGESVDLTNGSGNDTTGVRWDMGENIPGIGAIRDMADPGRFQDPDRTNSPNYYCGSGDSGGVHINSGVPNKAFTLMVDGGTFNGQTVTSIGLDAAAAIQYRTNEVYLTSSSNFLANYNFLIRSCGDLYGSTSATCTNVKNAVEAVRMNGSVCGSGGATATPGGGAPTATPVGPTATPPPSGGSITNGTFESGRNVGWAESDNLGYALVTSGSAYQGSWKAWLGGANNEISEISQNVTVPSGATLYYRYKITSSDSCGWDYGYVRVNTTTVKTYNLCSSSVTSGYVQGSVSLAAYAGQTVTLRFRATTDTSATSSFYIDNVGYSASLMGAGEGSELAGSEPGLVTGETGKPEPKPAGPEAAPDR